MSGALIDGNSEIGSYSYVGFNSFVTRAKIGRYASIGPNVSIGLGEHRPDAIATSALFYTSAYDSLASGECIVGNDVWVGVDAIVRRGIRVGDGAIIGANSFVNKDVAPFAVVAGSPARVIRFRFPPDQVDAIMASRWWNLELDEARAVISTLRRKFE